MILLTGASGLLGGTLVQAIRARGLELVAAYHGFSIAGPGITAVGIDLQRDAEIDALVERFRPKLVINAAAVTNVDWCEAHPDLAQRIHATAAGRLAASAARQNARFIHISTDSVFGGDRGGYVETDATNPLNVYARSKLAGEAAVLAAHPDALVVRTNIYGWNVQPKTSLAEWMLGKLEASEPFDGFEDVITTPLLTNDLADALLDLAAAPVRGVLHVAGGEACSKLDFARRIAGVFGLDASLIRPSTVAEARLSAPRPRDASLDCTLAARHLGRPLPSVEAGLRRFKLLRDNGFVDQLHALRGDLSLR